MKYGVCVVAVVLGLQTASAFAACDTSKPNQKPTSGYVLKGATAFDKATNLTWQRCSVGQTWDGKGCAGAVKGVPWLDGQALAENGWRIPTIDELKTLVSPTCAKPAINEDVFPGIDKDSYYYWSMTEPRENSVSYLDFATGSVSADAPAEPYSVRFVRTGP